MAATKPLVSIVIPAYNARQTLVSTLNSVRNQTFRDFETLIVDDCSTDETREQAARFAEADARFKLVALEQNFGGPAGPRNVGVRTAKGELVAFLDADDIWHPNKLALQIHAMRTQPSGFCSTQMINFKNENDLCFSPVENCSVQSVSFPALLFKARFPTSSVLLERDIALKFPFVEDKVYRAREDYDCWLRCHEYLGRSIKLLDPLVNYRISNQQISSDKIEMMRRHYHVLYKYRLTSGRQIGPFAALFTFTHFALSLIHRAVLRRL